MKKLKFIVLLALTPLIIACNNGGGGESASTGGGSGGDTPSASTGGGGGDTSSIDRSSFVWTITFDSQGGSAVASQEVKDGEKATEPTDPTYEGYVFQGWYKDTYAVTPFDFDTAITADWTLYAGWAKSLDPATSSSEPGSSTPSTGSTPAASDPYGPEGSELVDWYIVGAGANFSGWNTAGGIQMYSDPSEGSTNKACILNVTFAVGDEWKLYDGSTWLGYDSVKSGADNFTDTGGFHNIGVATAGAYDVYLNTSNEIYIVAHTA